MFFGILAVIMTLMGYFAHAKDKHNVIPTKCSVPIKPRELDQQPLYIVMKKNKFSFAKPILENGEVRIIVEEPESLILVCPQKNLLKKEFNQEIFLAKCTKKGWKPSVEEMLEKKCENRVTFTVKEIGKKSCAENSKMYEIGVDVQLKSKSFLWVMKTSYVSNKWSTEWFPLYAICFNKVNKTAIYAKHKIDGASIDARQTGIIESPKFEHGKEYDSAKGKIDPESAYTLEAIKRELTQQLSLVAKFDVERKHWIAKTLVPDGDMLFLNWKIASYFYINAVPFWKNMQCVWRNLEQKIRNAASILKKELTIYTGTYKNYEIFNRMVTLAKDKGAIKISLYLWKIIYHEESKTGIAFVMNNNPYSKNYLCKPDDTEIGKTWKVSNKLAKLGQMYSCKVNDLLDALKNDYEIPQLEINGELQFPNPAISIDVMDSTIFEAEPS